MNYSFDWGTVVRGWPYLMGGMGLTLLLVAISMVLGIFIGTLLAIARLYGSPWLQTITAGYVNFFRSIPLILTIFWLFFLFPPLLRWIVGDPNLSVGAMYSAIVAFTLAESAYYCEIIRAGISSVRRGQTDAAFALGMNRRQALQKIILPQAFKNMMPSLINQTVALLKDTSLVYVVSLNDFLGAATKLGQRDSRLVEMYLLVAVVYLAMCSAGVWLVGRVRK